MIGSRVRSRRLGAILATTFLTIALIPGLTTAANSRIVYFGSTGGDYGGGFTSTGDLKFGTLTTSPPNTPVTAGMKWATEVLLRNDSGSTLNHVKIAGGATTNDLPFNGLFSRPDGDSLPTADSSFAKVIVLEGTATCDPDAGPGIACDVGTLAGGAFVKFLVVVTAPATANTYDWWLTASWNEGWSSTGTNADYNFATGRVDVKASNCDNGQSSYFLGTDSVNLTDGGSTGVCTTQDAAITSGATLNTNPDFTNGGFAKVVIDSADITCPAAYKCFGKPVSVSILNGNPVPGGVQWTVTWYGTKTIKGVLHVSDDPTPTFTPIYLTKAYKCNPPTKTTDCWNEIKTSAGNEKPVWVKVTFVTASNGKGIGF